MADSPAGIAGVFDRAAETYDAVGVPWFQPIAQGLVRELAVRPGERILDIGCGRGAALMPLAAATGPGGSVLGIDLAPRMVELTARDAEYLPQVTVQVADASAPNLPASSFDLIASCLVLFFLPEPAAAVRVWAELLVPGGRMGVTTFGEQDERWKRIDAIFAPYLPQRMLDARTSGATGPFASDAGMEELYRNAGLVDVRTVHDEVQAVFRGPEHLVDFTWSHGQRAMWESVPAGERDAVRTDLIAAARQFQHGSRALTLTQQVRHTLGRRP